MKTSPDLLRRYRRLSLGDVFLSFAGYRGPDDPVHGAVVELSPGDKLKVGLSPAGHREICDSRGVVVGRIATSFNFPKDMRCAEATVLATATWSRADSEPGYQEWLRSERWEVVVPELALQPAGQLAFTV